MSSIRALKAPLIRVARIAGKGNRVILRTIPGRRPRATNPGATTRPGRVMRKHHRNHPAKETDDREQVARFSQFRTDGRTLSENSESLCRLHTHGSETQHGYLFNNGYERGWSSIEEIVPPVDAKGAYQLTVGKSYGPDKPAWHYEAKNSTDFFLSEISGAHRLPNGNTLICAGVIGNLFEITPAGETEAS
jgi:hypothetical protein